VRLAQFASLFIYGFIARWYVMPWLKALGRADALIVLLWVHVFRYVALFTFSAQHDGYPISDVAAFEIVVGDVAGAALAFGAIIALRYRSYLGLVLSWLLAIETIFDLIIGIHRRILEPLRANVGGVLWLVLVFFVPMIIVSLAMLIWQLYARRGEPLSDSREGNRSRGIDRARVETASRNEGGKL
jgi:hypothetical protein